MNSFNSHNILPRGILSFPPPETQKLERLALGPPLERGPGPTQSGGICVSSHCTVLWNLSLTWT